VVRVASPRPEAEGFGGGLDGICFRSTALSSGTCFLLAGARVGRFQGVLQLLTPAGRFLHKQPEESEGDPLSVRTRRRQLVAGR
jgi:hypothetical protein